MIWLEWSGILANVISNVYLFKKKTDFWIWGIVGNICWVIYFLLGGKWMAAGLQLSFILFSIYGWWRWRHATSEASLSLRDERLSISLTFLMILAGVMLTDFNGPDPILEAAGVVLFAAANWMTMKKWRISWYFWILGSVVSGIWYWRIHAYGMTLAQAMFIAMSVYGLYAWSASEKQETHPQAIAY